MAHSAQRLGVILLSASLALTCHAGAVNAEEAASWRPAVGERLQFQGRWMGIPVGHGSLEVKERVTVNGRDALRIEAVGRTNDVLSSFYPIEDRLESYLDAETLRPLRFEKHQREGKYRSDEVVVFDHAAGLARYESLRNGSRKEIPIPETVHDLVSAIYAIRAQALEPNSTQWMDLYTDEKIYRTEIRIGPAQWLEQLKAGTFRVVAVEPKASFKGVLVKRGRIWAYMTQDAPHLPLQVKATTPWGQMSAILEPSSIPAEVLERARHAGRDSARP